MEKKQAKTFEECCEEVAKKYPSNEFDHLDLADTDSERLINRFKESAELYNQETAAERDRLKEELDYFKKGAEYQLGLQHGSLEQSKQIDSLKEENNRLREDVKTLGEVGYFSIDRLKEENEKLLKTLNKALEKVAEKDEALREIK